MLRKKYKIILFVLGIIWTIIFFSKITNYLKNYKNQKWEEISVDYYLNNVSNPTIQPVAHIETEPNPVPPKTKKKIINYDMIIEIPKIKLRKGILSKDNKANNVDKNVTILRESVYPNTPGNIYIAAHSGNGKKSFFNDLPKLKEKDVVFLYYKNKKYSYELDKQYEISKNTNLSLMDTSLNHLYLITCSQIHKNKYLISRFTAS